MEKKTQTEQEFIAEQDLLSSVPEETLLQLATGGNPKETIEEVTEKGEIKPGELVPEIKILPEAGIEPEVPVEELIPQDYYKTSPTFLEVAKHFDLLKPEWEEAKHKLSLIVDWAVNQGKSNKIEDIMSQIRSLELRLSPPEAGERRYLNVFRFVKLAQI